MDFLITYREEQIGFTNETLYPISIVCTKRKGVNLMKKWALAAIIYLLVVIAGYTVYTKFFEKTNAPKVEASEHHEHQEQKQEGQVLSQFHYEDGSIHIRLTDLSNNPIPLEVNHEKLLHLIIVDESLNQYTHLHPTKVSEGEFTVEKTLSNGKYKAFIDIKPKGLDYSIKPIPFEVGNSDEGSQTNHIVSDSSLTKTVEGKTVKLKMSSTKPNEPITLSFELDQSNLEPYLGAMGHVVILDKKANHFLHVHPEREDQPVFVTQFEKEGIYKIWAEFKQENKVRVFPFVVEIKK